MFVCIVMNYYEAGDLDGIIRKQRAKETPLPEMVLKKWFGQMVEAMAFVHDRKVIHRDLKPSNIFMTNELDVRVGDFGVATVMDGARTRTRTTVGECSLDPLGAVGFAFSALLTHRISPTFFFFCCSGTMNYMAPEVLERPYNEKSDIWSLGCIILDAITCDFLDVSRGSSDCGVLKIAIKAASPLFILAPFYFFSTHLSSTRKHNLCCLRLNTSLTELKRH